MILTTVIICTRDRRPALIDTLESLRSVDVPSAMKGEVLVVDNGSTDDTLQCVSGLRLPNFQLKVLRQPEGGKSVALNTALREAMGELLLFIDDDVRPAPDWLAEITAPLIAGRLDAVTGTVRIPLHLQRPWMGPSHYAWLAASDDADDAYPEAAVGANMGISREVLSRVPAFDPDLGPGRLGLWEDTLFSMQIKRAGLRLGRVPAAVVEHHFDASRLSRAAFISRARAEGRSSAYVAWHWRHEVRDNVTARMTEYSLRLVANRVLRSPEWWREEGISQWEMDLVCGIEFEQSYRRESKKPRAYEQYGTRKLKESVLTRSGASIGGM